MAQFLLQIFTWVFLTFMLTAAFISIRDVLKHRRSILWLSLIAIGVALFMFLFFTQFVPMTAWVFVLIIAVPIFLTDKRRDIDWLDWLYRFFTLAALIIAVYLYLNRYVF